MARPRLIPVLLLDRDRRLVKTVGFNSRTYIGDPFNVLRLFNEKEVDEIVVLDIDATIDDRAPDLGFIAELASECFVPLSYGGGLRTARLCEEVAAKGIEKLVIGAMGVDEDFVASVSASLGAQAVIGCLDYHGSGAGAQVKRPLGPAQGSGPLLETAQRLCAAGCGELILQSVVHDGTRAGYDLDTIAFVAPKLPVPVIALGGAGEAEHLASALRAGASAAASGSAFSFIGPLRAVLVTYPEPAWIEGLSRDLSERAV